MLGENLGGRVVQVGPVKAPNFPWVLLGRAWLHHQLVAERNHAQREAITLALQGEQNLMDGIPEDLARALGRSFSKLSSRADNPEFGEALTGLIEQVLALSLTGSRPEV